MRCPSLKDLPKVSQERKGWPWDEESKQLSEVMTNGKPWPKVSIVTPSYNQGKFIEESIRSVLLQGYPNLEYIIIDAGSKDESIEIIKKYESWISYWVSEPDRGQSNAINKGLAKSNGDFFNWQNADDVLTPNSLATAVAAFTQHPNASYVFGYCVVIDEQSKPIYESIRPELKAKGDSDLGFCWSLYNLRGGCQPGCLMDQHILKRIGGVDEELTFVMDADVLLRLSMYGPVYYIEKPLVYYRSQPEAKSLSKKEDHGKLRAEDRLIIANKLFKHKSLPKSARKFKGKAFSTAHQYAWKWYAEVEQYGCALWHFLCDIFYFPSDWDQRRGILYNLESIRTKRSHSLFYLVAKVFLRIGQFYLYLKYLLSRLRIGKKNS